AGSSEAHRRRFVYRHSLLTHARAVAHAGDRMQAIEILDQAIRLAAETQDRWLQSSARLLKAELVADGDRSLNLLLLFDQLIRQTESYSLDRPAALEQAIACGLVATGDHRAGRDHAVRAKAIYDAVDYRLGSFDLSTNPTLSKLELTDATAPANE